MPDSLPKVDALGLMKRAVLRVARVPADPHVPDGSQGSVRVFNAGRNYLYVRLAMWALSNLLTLICLSSFLAAATFARTPPLVHAVWSGVAWIAMIALLLLLPVTFLVQVLNYQMRWYIVTDRSLRVRRGIVFVEEMTMTFANIQEIQVKANPFERLLGLANLEVHAAGGGAADAHGISRGHVGRFQGVDNASEIRDLITERLRVYRDSGLGERGHEPWHALASDGLAEARDVLNEVMALRQALALQRQA